MNSVLIFFVGSLTLSLILTRLVRTWAMGTALVAVPDGGRHTHARPVPQAGGIAIFTAVAVVLLAGFLVGVPHTPDSMRQVQKLIGLIAGCTAMFGIGLLDDWRPLGARTKFMLEILVASAVFAAGVRITSLGAGGLVLPMWASYPITVLWIVGITNAFNLIDGSDGIAGGAALFAALCMATVSAISGDMVGVIASVAIAGATMGFLFFNFPPASIFLGDSGSLFLGFSLAGLGIITTQEASATLAVSIPVLSFGLPILDTMLAIGRRFLRRQPIFHSDRAHIHHRLRDLGHSPRKVAFLLYGACALFSLLSLLLLGPARPYSAAVFIVAGAAIWLAVQRLHIPEVLEVQRIMQRSMRQRHVIAANVKLHEAVGVLKTASAPEDIFRALTILNATGEFDAIEVFLPQPYAYVLREHSAIRLADGAPVWRWQAGGGPHTGPDSVEVRLPLGYSEGKRPGRISLWLATNRDFVYPDLLVLTGEFRRELSIAILRVATLMADDVVPHSEPLRDSRPVTIGSIS